MSTNQPVPQRIGDAERDQAVEALREHHSLGRLDVTEFEDRMGRALTARTAADLVGLFQDLPDPRPAVLTALDPAPSGWAMPTIPPIPVASVPGGQVPTPWYAQWWMILVAVGVTAMTGGRLGFIIPMMAIWLWVVYPSLVRSGQLRAGAQATTPALTDDQQEQVRRELTAGNRIAAIKLYREFTGVDLRRARDAVEVMQHQLGR